MKLITRSDFDGLVCAALLEELGIIDEILYAHPKDIQDNKIEVTQNDVLANVPFVEGCGMWFDHHSSETERIHLEGKFKGACESADSAARVISNYYKAEYGDRLDKFKELLEVVDIADSARFTESDVLDPKGWMMLAFITDPRSGLGYHRDFTVSNFELMKSVPKLLRTKNAQEILAMPDFQERVTVYNDETARYKAFLKETIQVKGDAIVLDLRNTEKIPSGNRFMEYVLFPDQNISIRLAKGKDPKVTMISVGHSILNRTSQVDVGSLALKYGGGGHKKVGTCQVPTENADTILKEMLDIINP
jgi:oligoribonuclease NrnB/cAMP/cGMP phosphodiesterase (DHH superfamily)